MPPSAYLDPKVLARVQALELRARAVVEGYLSGQHRSPQRGFAVEFAQHREYSPGDDIKHVDWKVFGRTERFYLKQYEQDTNLVAWLVVDASESMRYGSGTLSKYDLASTAAAALAYLIVQQSDSVGLATFDEQLRDLLRPSGQPTQVKEIVRRLAVGPAPKPTQVGTILRQLAEQLGRRGIVFLCSDLFDEPEALRQGLKRLRFHGHEVIVLHTLDAAELEFPFEQTTLFRGLEALPELLTDPRGVRQGYLAELQVFLDAVAGICRAEQVDYLQLRTDTDLGLTLAGYLSQRLRK